MSIYCNKIRLKSQLNCGLLGPAGIYRTATAFCEYRHYLLEKRVCFWYHRQRSWWWKNTRYEGLVKGVGLSALFVPLFVLEETGGSMG